MAAQAPIEANGSGRWATGDKPWLELDYFVRCDSEDDTEDAVIVAVLDNVPTYRSLPRVDTPLVLRGVSGQPEQVAPLWWKTTARYESSTAEPQTNDSTWSFETTGGTTKILISSRASGCGTLTRYDNSEKQDGSGAPDLGGLINANDQDVQGTDIVIPQYAFSETHYLPDSTITPAYKNALYNLTGRMNQAQFREHEPHECLFLGAKGAKRGRGDWELTFSFAASPNVRGLRIGAIGGVGGVLVDKDGWDFLWPRTLPVTCNGVLIRRIVGVYVERVYQEGDFSRLSIGT